MKAAAEGVRLRSKRKRSGPSKAEAKKKAAKAERLQKHIANLAVEVAIPAAATVCDHEITKKEFKDSRNP